jgi:5'-nucleotidase
MRFRSTAIAALLGLVTLGASPACKPGQPVVLTILHTNDLHSHLRAAKNDPFGLGGLARIKTLLDRLRGQAELSLTLDAGDWSEGSWYFSVDAGSNMLEFLNKMGYDAVCVGNHDLLDGPDQLVSTVRAASPHFPVLAANFDAKKYASQKDFRQVIPPYVIRDVSGLKVGIIGLTIAPGDYDTMIAPVKIIDPVQAAQDVAQDLRPKVDVMLIVSHNDFDLNRRLAREVPGVDAVISGHTHLKTPKAVIEMSDTDRRQVPVVETGYWGKFVGELQLEIQTAPTVDPQGPIRMKSYALHPVSPDVPEDPEIAAMADEQDRLLSARYGDIFQTVNQTDFDIDQSDFQESPLGGLAVKAYRAATGADAAVEAQSFTGIGIAQGPVTLMDLHDVLPHTYSPATGKEWTIHLWDATGKDLKTFFDMFFLLTGIMPTSSPVGWLDSDNLSFTWTPIVGKTTLDVKGLLVGGEPVDDLKHYKVALTDGVITGMKVFNHNPLTAHWHVDDSRITDTGIEAWRAVVAYGSKAGNLSLENLRIGGHARTSGPDLAVFTYDVGLDDAGFVVTVENQGVQPSDPSKVTCSTGLANDFVAYNTDEQKWTVVGQTPVSALVAGQRTEVLIPWDHSKLQGYWPVKCEVDGGGRYHVNNRATKVFNFRHN